jgi:hypothetical protein
MTAHQTITADPASLIAAKLASGELYTMSREDVEDRAGGGVYIRRDGDVEVAYWRNRIGQPWQECAIDVPLCGSCDQAVDAKGFCARCAS